MLANNSGCGEMDWHMAGEADKTHSSDEEDDLCMSPISKRRRRSPSPVDLFETCNEAAGPTSLTTAQSSLLRRVSMKGAGPTFTKTVSFKYSHLGSTQANSSLFRNSGGSGLSVGSVEFEMAKGNS